MSQRYKVAIMCYDSEIPHVRFVGIEVEDDELVDEVAEKAITDMDYSLNSVEWMASKTHIEVLYGYEG